MDKKEKQNKIKNYTSVTQSEYMEILKRNYENKIYREEWKTKQGVNAYRWTTTPNRQNRIRIETVDGIDIPIYQRNMA